MGNQEQRSEGKVLRLAEEAELEHGSVSLVSFTKKLLPTMQCLGKTERRGREQIAQKRSE